MFAKRFSVSVYSSTLEAYCCFSFTNFSYKASLRVVKSSKVSSVIQRFNTFFLESFKSWLLSLISKVVCLIFSFKLNSNWGSEYSFLKGAMVLKVSIFSSNCKMLFGMSDWFSSWSLVKEMICCLILLIAPWASLCLSLALPNTFKP